MDATISGENEEGFEQGNSRQTKFDNLKLRFQNIREKSRKREQKVENKKLRRAILQAKKCESPEKSHEESPKLQLQNEPEFKELIKYMDVNSHLTGSVSHGSALPKSGLEERITVAVRTGEYETAECLSDQLAERDMGVRLASAFAAKNYAEEKKEMDLAKKSKSRKKLVWGFEAKQRWEIKGNM